MLEAMHEMTSGDALRVLAFPALILFLLGCGWLINALRLDKTPEELRTVKRYRVAPHHHVIDMKRSSLIPLHDGALLARCCYIGCDVTVTIGSDVAGLAIELLEEDALELRTV